MEKIKDYFINFVLFLVYFIIVLFALVFNNLDLSQYLGHDL